MRKHWGFIIVKTFGKPCEVFKISLVFLPACMGLLCCDPIQQFCIWIQIFYSVILCLWVSGSWHSDVSRCLPLLKMKAVLSYEMMGATNLPTQSHIYVDLNPLKHWCENFTSCIFASVIQVNMAKIFNISYYFEFKFFFFFTFLNWESGCILNFKYHFSFFERLENIIFLEVQWPC